MWLESSFQALTSFIAGSEAELPKTLECSNNPIKAYLASFFANLNPIINLIADSGGLRAKLCITQEKCSGLHLLVFL